MNESTVGSVESTSHSPTNIVVTNTDILVIIASTMAALVGLCLSGFLVCLFRRSRKHGCVNYCRRPVENNPVEMNGNVIKPNGFEIHHRSVEKDQEREKQSMTCEEVQVINDGNEYACLEFEHNNHNANLTANRLSFELECCDGVVHDSIEMGDLADVDDSTECCVFEPAYHNVAGHGQFIELNQAL